MIGQNTLENIPTFLSLLFPGGLYSPKWAAGKYKNVFSPSKEEFKNAIETRMKMKITKKENQYLFDMVNSKRDGVVDVKDELNFKIRNRRIRNIFRL